MGSKRLNEKRALTLTEAAQYACLSRGTVQNWISQGLLPFEEFPGRGDGFKRLIRIRLEDLKAFLDLNYHKPNQINKVKKQDNLILLPQNNSKN